MDELLDTSMELHFKQWLEDVGISQAGYSNAEDRQFANKVNSKWSARGDQKTKERGWDHSQPDQVFGMITNFADPPPGSLPKNGGTNAPQVPTQPTQMSKGMKKKMKK